jgi:transglutaminase-like putative cysteine protease
MTACTIGDEPSAPARSLTKHRSILILSFLRYCTGYLGDIGVPVDPAPMDFSAWFEAYLDGRWFTFDARHNCPRIGRIVDGKGRLIPTGSRQAR